MIYDLLLCTSSLSILQSNFRLYYSQISDTFRCIFIYYLTVKSSLILWYCILHPCTISWACIEYFRLNFNMLICTNSFWKIWETSFEQMFRKKISLIALLHIPTMGHACLATVHTQNILRTVYSSCHSIPQENIMCKSIMYYCHLHLRPARWKGWGPFIQNNTVQVFLMCIV